MTSRKMSKKNIPYIISLATHIIFIILISMSFESTVRFPTRKDMFISMNVSLTSDDQQLGNNNDLKQDSNDQALTKNDHPVKVTNEEKNEKTNEDSKENTEKITQKIHTHQDVVNKKVEEKKDNNIKETVKIIEKKDTQIKETKELEKHIEKNKLQEVKKHEQSVEKNKRKFQGLGGFLSGLQSKNAALVTGTNAASIRQQIASIWAISVFNQESIKGMEIMTEITIINSEIKNISIIDDLSSKNHEKYSVVKESVIKVLNKCKKLNLVGKFKSGEHIIRFKFVC